MQTIRWYRLLAVGMLAAPIGGHAQGPQPIVKEIATIPGVDMENALRMPNGQVIVYAADDSIAAYNVITKTTTLITRTWGYDLALSPQGDRIAFTRSPDHGNSNFVWALAIDPASGAPSGQAQRVSIAQGDTPAFSPDGRWIAFASGGTSGPDQGRYQNLAVLPATGGPQRVLAQYHSELGKISWSGDGQWVYVLVYGAERTTERVRITGGATERVLAYTGRVSLGSIDGQVAFFHRDAPAISTGRVDYVTAAGTRGAFDIPAESAPGYSLDAAHTILIKTAQPMLVHAMQMDNGQVHQVASMPQDAAFASWSPDGRRLAFASGNLQHLDLVVMSADGSGQRSTPVRNGSFDVWGMGSSLWSPDGTSLLYYADSLRELRVMNVATGESRHVASFDTLPLKGTLNATWPDGKSAIGWPPIWQPDGKSFLVHSRSLTDSGQITNSTIVEIGLDGSRHTVRDLSAEFPGIRNAYLASNREVVVMVGTSSQTQLYLVPLASGGTVRKVSLPPLDSGTVLLLSARSDRNVVAGVYQRGRTTGALVVSLATASGRLVPFPPDRLWSSIMIFPGDDRLGVIGKILSEPFQLYSFPIDGGAPALLAPLASAMTRGLGTASGNSSDGRFFAWFSPGTPTTHIYDIDLTPVLQPAIRH